jgi:hypothetical protein
MKIKILNIHIYVFMKRIIISLSEIIAECIKKKPKISRFITVAVQEKREQERREKLRKNLIEGYQNEKQEAQEVNSEWEASTLESWKLV